MKQSRIDFIKKAHESACSSWKARIEKEFPKIFQQEFKVGDWVYFEYKLKNGSNVDRVVHVKKGKSCTLCFDGDMMTYDEYNAWNPKRFRKATKEEIESHLIAEAGRRGFVVGTKFKNIESGKAQTLTRLNHYYTEKYDGLCSGCTDEKDWKKAGCESNAYLYYKGQWAEIIEQTPSDIQELLEKYGKEDLKKYL